MYLPSYHSIDIASYFRRRLFGLSHFTPYHSTSQRENAAIYRANLQLQTHGKGRLRFRGAKCLAFRKASSSTQKNLGQLMSESAQPDLAFQM